MKSIIKTTLFAAFTLAIAINSGKISKQCIESYNNCVSYMSSNACVPNGF